MEEQFDAVETHDEILAEDTKDTNSWMKKK